MFNANYERDFAIVALLKVCAKKKDLCKGIEVHADIVKMGLLEKSPYLASSVINMYVKCGMLEKAHQTHDELCARNIVSWNTLISGYARQGQGLGALNCYQQMLNEGFSPDEVTLVSVLKACASISDIDKGKKIHDEIVLKGLLEKHITLGTSLVDMYAKCGMLAKAQEVLKELRARDVVSWSVLISEYARQGQGHKAITCFEEMQCEGIAADVVTYACVLKGCGSVGAIDKGKEIHEEIVSKAWLRNNSVLEIALVDMYAKCGELKKAQQLHEELYKPSVMSWNALLSGYVQQGLGHDTMNGFKQMRREGFSPDNITFVCVVKACGIVRCFRKGKEIHSEISCMGLLAKSAILGTALVDMYAKFGMLRKAKQVLYELPVRDVFSWSALISGCTQQMHYHEALSCFKLMQDDGFSPNAVTLISILKACANIGAIDQGEQIHEQIVSRGLSENDAMLGTALLDMYAKCGFPVKARQVFEDLSVRDVVSWSALIDCYADHGQGRKALEFLKRMQCEGLFPNEVTFVCALKACGRIGALDIGEQIDQEIAVRGLLGGNIVLDTALVDMYAKCGMLAKAERFHESLAVRSTVTWNALMSGHIGQGRGHEAWSIFESMQIEGVSPDVLTFVSALKACVITGNISKGEQIHGEILANGLLGENPMLGSALVDMYARCGLLGKAQQCHDNLSVQSIVSWNSLISGYAQEGRGHEAWDCYERMQDEGFSPNEATLVFVLKACGAMGNVRKGKEIHDEIVRSKGTMLDESAALWIALVGMYAKCGSLERAAELLGELPSGESACWNALISGYAEQGHSDKALDCFEQMQEQGSSPIATTFLFILKACGGAGALGKGERIHEEIECRGWLESDVALGTALIGMYARCGALGKAAEVLERLPARDSVAWNALMAGYAQQGRGREALDCFQSLQAEGLSPDAFTFASVLSACSHSGLVEEAKMHYESIARRYDMVPTVEHRMCLVVGLGYAGQFGEAISVVAGEMAHCDRTAMWLAMLGACRRWRNARLGKLAFEQLLQRGAGCGAAYAMMTQLYADCCAIADRSAVSRQTEKIIMPR